MKIIIWGLGVYFKANIEKLIFIDQLKNVIGYVDSVKKYIDGVPFLDGVEVQNPNNIVGMDYDLLLIMSVKVDEIKKQAISMGIPENKIIDFETFFLEYSSGFIKCYGDVNRVVGQCRILFLSTELNYNGGTIAAEYAVRTLLENGYDVVFAAPFGNDKYISELVKKGLKVIICPGIFKLSSKEFKIVDSFDIVIINVFQMAKCVVKITNIKPVIWWIHEPTWLYKNTYLSAINEKYNDRILPKVNILAVSKVAKQNFEKYYPDRIDNVLHYTIPDMSKKHIEDDKIVFAIIGPMSKGKGYDIFFQAIDKLAQKTNVEFWCIGRINQNMYTDYYDIIKKNESIVFKGVLNREEMWEAWRYIDVVVVASREETMSMVATEGFINRSICILSDAVGIAEYVRDSVDGFIFPSENASLLADKMQYVIDNYNTLEYMRNNGRKIYDKFFTPDVFIEQINHEIIVAKNKFAK